MSNILWKNFQHCFYKFISCPAPSSPRRDDHIHSHSHKPLLTTTALTQNSLYDAAASFTTNTTDDSSSSSADSSDAPPLPDFTAAFASHRFFFSSPGLSNSIIDHNKPPQPMTDVVVGGVAVPTESPDPYLDFRRSMEEMVVARGDGHPSRAMDWDYLQELLLCYLALNPKHTHKFIVGAFADLLVSLLSSPSAVTAGRRRYV